MSDAKAILEIHRCYQAVFLDEHGQLKPEAEIVMRDLERECRWMTEGLPVDGGSRVDPLALAGMHEKRAVYAHLRKRIFAPIQDLKRKAEK